VFFNDMTMLCYRAVPDLPVYAPRSFFFPTGYGTLGSAMPSAIGARMACPEVPVVALCGDGGFLFTAQELATAVHASVDVTILVFNDSVYGAVKRVHERRFEGRSLGVTLTNPDFVRFAESFGVRSRRAESPEELQTALADLGGTPGPVLVEYALSEVPPL